MENQREQSIKIIAKDGKAELLTGSAFNILEGKTEKCFQTNIIKEFVKYVDTLVAGDVNVFYDESSILAFPKDISYDEGELASCTLKNSMKLAKIISIANKDIQLKFFEEFLMSMKGVIDKNGIELLDKVKSFKVSKTTEIIRQKDQGGNYTFSVKRESGGKEDVIFPDTISFTVPLFKYHEWAIDLEFDVYFDFTQADDNVAIMFRLQNYELDDFIQDRKQAVLDDEIKSIKHPYYWGDLDVENKTDAWKYQSNPAR